jgi:hypothetical protein
VPAPVLAELSGPNAPLSVRRWIVALSAWLEVSEIPAKHKPDPALKDIHAGELAAISLAAKLKADLLAYG